MGERVGKCERRGYLRRCCCGNFMNWRMEWRTRAREIWRCLNCGKTYEEEARV